MIPQKHQARNKIQSWAWRYRPLSPTTVQAETVPPVLQSESKASLDNLERSCLKQLRGKSACLVETTHIKQSVYATAHPQTKDFP